MHIVTIVAKPTSIAWYCWILFGFVTCKNSWQYSTKPNNIDYNTHSVLFGFVTFIVRLPGSARSSCTCACAGACVALPLMQWPSLPCVEAVDASNRQGILYFSETSQHRCLNSSLHGGGAARPGAIGAACSDSQCCSSGGGLAANGCGWVLQRVDEIVGVDYVGACEFRNFLDRPEEEVRGRSSRKKFVACMAGTFASGARLLPEWRAPTSTVIPAPARSFQMRNLRVVENLLCETGASLENR